VVVDLGPCEELREQNCQIRKGDQISASGRFTQAGSSRVFVADSVRADGRTVEIDRSFTVTMSQLRREANQLMGSSSQGQQYQQQQQGQQGQQYQGQQGSRSSQWASRDQEENSQYGRSSQQGGQSGTSQRISGKVTRTQRLDLPGMQESIQAVQLRTDQGQQVIAILGPEEDLQGIQLNKGDEVSVRGMRTWVNGSQVILARSVNANGQTAQVPVQRQQQQRISGEITRTRWIQLPGMRSQIQVACVKTEQGREVIAVLGSEESMSNHELNRGDEVTLRGDLLNVNGQRILLTQQISSNGQQTSLSHEPY
jgi:hypothetical protein